MDQLSEVLQLLRQNEDKQLARHRELDRLLFYFRNDMERHFGWVKFLLGMAIAFEFVLYVCVLAILFD